MVNTTEDLRTQILTLARDYYSAMGTTEFEAGKTYIPVSGKTLGGDDLANLVEASLDMWLTAGRFHDAFERALADSIGVKEARMTVSGSAANLLAFSALTSRLESTKLRRPIESGSEVVTVAASFPTTVAPIIQNACIPVFIDISSGTQNVDVSLLEDAITEKTRAIMLAHTLGNPFDLGAVTEIAEKYGLYLIEDCCDALGAKYQGRHVGTFGDVGTLSFYPAHQITTGEGGAVFTSSKPLARTLESFRDWGRDCWCKPGDENTCRKRFGWQLGDLPFGYDHKYIYSHLGYNLKATDMQAAVGISQIKKLDDFVAARQANFDALYAAFSREGLDEHFELPSATPESEPSWFGFFLMVRQGSPLQRREVVTYLESRKIGTRLLFGGNLIRQPAMREVKYRVVGSLTETDKVMRDGFWIGVWPGIGPAQIEYMVDTFRELVAKVAG